MKNNNDFNILKMSPPKHKIMGGKADFDLSPTLRLIIELDKNNQLRRVKKYAKKRGLEVKGKSFLILEDKIKEYEDAKGSKKGILKLDMRWSRQSRDKLYLAGMALKKSIINNKDELKITPSMVNLLKLDRSGRLLFRSKVNIRLELNKIAAAFIRSREISYLISEGKLDIRHGVNERDLKIVAGRFFKTVKNNPVFIKGVFNRANNAKVRGLILKNSTILNRYKKQFKWALKKELTREYNRIREQSIKEANNPKKIIENLKNRHALKNRTLKI